MIRPFPSWEKSSNFWKFFSFHCMELETLPIRFFSLSRWPYHTHASLTNSTINRPPSPTYRSCPQQDQVHVRSRRRLDRSMRSPAMAALFEAAETAAIVAALTRVIADGGRGGGGGVCVPPPAPSLVVPPRAGTGGGRRVDVAREEEMVGVVSGTSVCCSILCCSTRGTDDDDVCLCCVVYCDV